MSTIFGRGSVALLILAGLLVWPPPSRGQTDMPELRDVALARRARLHALQIKFTTTQSALPGFDSLYGGIREMQHDMLLDLDGGRSRMQRSVLLRDGTGGTPGLYTFDGQTESLYLTGAMQGTLSDERRIDPRNEANLLTLMMLNPPAPEGYGMNNSSLEDYLNYATLHPDLEEFNGRPCYVADWLHNGVIVHTVWLDAQRDLLPLRITSLGHDGQPNGESVAGEVVPIVGADGETFWLPTSWTSRGRIMDAWFERHIEVEVESVVVNPVLETADFQIDFPPGTTVTDARLGRVFRVPNPGETWWWTTLEELDAPARDRAVPFGTYSEERPDWIPAQISIAESPAPASESLRDATRDVPPPSGASINLTRPPPQPAPAPAEAPPTTRAAAPTSTQSTEAAHSPAVVAAPRSTPPPSVPITPSCETQPAPSPTGATAHREPWVWLAALLGAAILFWLYRAGRQLASGGKHERHWRPVLGRLGLAGVAALALVFLYSQVNRAPAPGRARLPTAVQAGAFAQPTVADYSLRDGEVLRYLSDAGPNSRRALVGELTGRDETLPIRSVTVLVNSTRHLRCLAVGEGPRPPMLYDVLCDSLRLPAYAFENLDAAREIPLPGDWVVQAGASPAEYLPELAAYVRARGHARFDFIPAERPATIYVARGTPRPPRVIIRLFDPPAGLASAPPQSGSVEQFLYVLGNAIGHRVKNELATVDGLHLTWEDNSNAYGGPLPALPQGAIPKLLEQVATELGVDIVPQQESATVWRLCAD